jgi:hypothetical protein
MLAGSRPSGESQYAPHVASASGTSHTHARLSQRWRSALVSVIVTY